MTLGRVDSLVENEARARSVAAEEAEMADENEVVNAPDFDPLDDTDGEVDADVDTRPLRLPDVDAVNVGEAEALLVARGDFDSTGDSVLSPVERAVRLSLVVPVDLGVCEEQLEDDDDGVSVSKDDCVGEEILVLLTMDDVVADGVFELSKAEGLEDPVVVTETVCESDEVDEKVDDEVPLNDTVALEVSVAVTDAETLANDDDEDS